LKLPGSQATVPSSRQHSYVIAMRLADDPGMARWVEGLAGASEDFEWDAGNRTKNAKHGVVAGEVESLLAAPVLFAGQVVEPAHDEPRWLLLGQTLTGRRLALIFTRRGDRLRPISCRPMRRKEREVYEEAVGNEG